MARPVTSEAEKPLAPLHYRWQDTYPALKQLAEGAPNPYEGYAMEYVNPLTGGSTLPTLSCWIQMLKPGQRTQSHRHTSTVLYHAFRGSGTTVINGHRSTGRKAIIRRAALALARACQPLIERTRFFSR